MIRFFSIFGAVLREFLFQVAVLWFYKTKQFAVFRNFRVNSKAVCGFRMLFCVVSIRNAV